MTATHATRAARDAWRQDSAASEAARKGDAGARAMRRVTEGQGAIVGG